MNDHPYDRLADAFLAPGPVVLPDRVLHAAFEEVHRTRQRRVLWGMPWRFLSMNSNAKIAVAAVAVVAIGLLGITFLRPGDSDVGGAPSAVPSPTVAPSTSAAPSGPPLTGQFTSDRHGFSISYPEGWSTKSATTAWTSGIVDYFNPGSDLLVSGTAGNPGAPFVALASQPLAGRTREQFEADYWQIMVDDDPGAAACAAASEPITVDGAAGVMACHAALVTDGDRGYVAMLWSSDGPPVDDAWLASVLSTMRLEPEAAVD